MSFIEESIKHGYKAKDILETISNEIPELAEKVSSAMGYGYSAEKILQSLASQFQSGDSKRVAKSMGIPQKYARNLAFSADLDPATVITESTTSPDRGASFRKGLMGAAATGAGLAAGLPGKAGQLAGAISGAIGGEGEQPIPQQPVEPRAQAEEVPQPAVEEPASELSPQDAFKALEERGLGNIMKSLGQQLDADSIRGAVANIKGKKFVSDLEKSMGTPAVEIFAKAKEFVGSPKEAQPVTEAKTPIRFKSKSDDQERWKWHSQKWGKDKESYEPISKHGQYEIWHRSQEKGRGGIGEIRAIDQDGNVVGLVSYDDAGKGKIEAAVEVDPKHRRKGIASKLYEESEKQSGKTLQPAEEQTPFSKALWEKEGKKFGREQKINLKEKGHSEFRPEVSFEKGNKDLSKYLSNIGTIQMPKDAKLSKDAKPLQALKSSNVRYADYDPENKTLQVLFAPTSGKSGEIYEYNDVPEEDVLGMMKGSGTAVTRGANSFRAWFGGKNPSIGRAFKDFIAKKDDKGDAVYPYRKISEKYVKDEDLKKIRGADTVHLATQYVDAFEDLTLQSQAKTRAEGLKKVSSALKEIDDSLLEDMIFQVTKAVGQEVKQAKRKGKQKRFKGGKESEIEKRVKEMAGVR